MATGLKTSAIRKQAPKNIRCCPVVDPLIEASIAVVPKIKTGMISGTTSKEINTLPLFDPKISAAPNVPIKLIVGVPIAKVIKSVP